MRCKCGHVHVDNEGIAWLQEQRRADTHKGKVACEGCGCWRCECPHTSLADFFTGEIMRRLCLDCGCWRMMGGGDCDYHALDEWTEWLLPLFNTWR